MEAEISHTTRVADVRVHDIAALKEAVASVSAQVGRKMTLKEDADCRLWGMSKERCEAVVTIDGCRFDVGFKRAKDGIGLTPIFDAHGSELYQIVGQGRAQAKTTEEHNLSNIGKLMQSYAFHAIQRQALMQGATMTTTTNDKGQMVLAVLG